MTIIHKVLQLIKRGLAMNVKMPKYDEEKATQVAAFLLQQSNNSMGLLELTKIMYNIQREAIKRWSFPITYDKICSLEHGQVLSDTYDNAKPTNRREYWDEYIGREEDVLSLKKSCPTGQLNRAEMSLIKEIYSRDKEKGLDKLLHEHQHYPEWVNPGTSSKATDYETLLKVLGKTSEQISTFKKDMGSEAYLKELIA